MNKRILGVLLMTFCLTVFLAVDIFGEEGAGNVCAECHEEVSMKFIGTAHGVSSTKCIDCQLKLGYSTLCFSLFLHGR